MTDSQSESRKQEEKLAWKRGGGGSMRFHNSRASGMTIDLWSALWASGVGGVAGSERLGVRGHGAEGWWGGIGGTAAGLGLEFGVSWQAH